MPSTCQREQETVAAACRRRHDCRAGLAGLRMIHQPTGRPFVCGGSKWNADGDLLILTRPSRLRDGSDPEARVYRGTEVLDRFEPYNPDEVVEAADCILVSEWPVVCCRPVRRRKTGGGWTGGAR